MAESSKEELLQLIKRFGAYLTVKMSSIFPISLHNLNSRSIGAIAGFAVAIVFTWRLLRSPSGPQRRQPKRQAPASSSSGISSQSNATLTTSGVSSSEDTRAQNVVDEFFQPVKPTLGQIVRQKLSEGRKVTCRLLGVVLEESTPEELQKQVTVRYSVLEVLLEITKFCDLYLMERVLDNETEKKVLLALEDAGVFTSGGLVKEKVLFCSTENGRTSFVRQLEPDWHIDTNPDIIFQLSRFIKYQLHISPTRTERAASNVFNSPSLEQFFGCFLFFPKKTNLGFTRYNTQRKRKSTAWPPFAFSNLRVSLSIVCVSMESDCPIDAELRSEISALLTPPSPAQVDKKHISWNEHGTGFFLNKKTIGTFYHDKVRTSGFLDGAVGCFKKQLSQFGVESKVMNIVSPNFVVLHYLRLNTLKLPRSSRPKLSTFISSVLIDGGGFMFHALALQLCEDTGNSLTFTSAAGDPLLKWAETKKYKKISWRSRVLEFQTLNCARDKFLAPSTYSIAVPGALAALAVPDLMPSLFSLSRKLASHTNRGLSPITSPFFSVSLLCNPFFFLYYVDYEFTLMAHMHSFLFFSINKYVKMFSSTAQRMDEYLLFANWNQIGISTQILTSSFNYMYILIAYLVFLHVILQSHAPCSDVYAHFHGFHLNY
ncbi:unnamed protein product [Prunus brigantina]